MLDIIVLLKIITNYVAKYFRRNVEMILFLKS